ncbi:MAG TPA: DGQHR domain-containing protein [Saprospiraceae bacterium]|nr:DGQHR domain-containing protein [Saprospiraceae bacterium]
MNKLIEIKGFMVNQLTYKPIATSSVRFSDLKSIVKFTAREPNDFDPFKPNLKLDDIVKQTNEQYFQRLIIEDRVRNIYLYLLDEINNKVTKKKSALGSFPTSIILSIDLTDQFENKKEYEESIEQIESEDYIGAYYSVDNNLIALSILRRNNTLIVDGQHRLAAMIKLYDDASNESIKIGKSLLNEKYPNLDCQSIKNTLNDFELNCTLLLGFDIWEQGKVFADVNFNQKPVNKSLYYDIFGSFPDPDRNDIFLSHMLAKHLNTNEKSDIKGFIKMLGTGKGYFSQAFFVEAIKDHLKPKGIWANIPLDYIKGGNKHEFLSIFFKAYFSAIKELFKDYWPKQSYEKGEKYDSILVKTTGMGALIKLINPVCRQLIKDGKNLETSSEAELKEGIIEILTPLKENASKYFSKGSEFAGAGSLGLQSKLYQTLGQDLGWFQKD